MFHVVAIRPDCFRQVQLKRPKSLGTDWADFAFSIYQSSKLLEPPAASSNDDHSHEAGMAREGTGHAEGSPREEHGDRKHLHVRSCTGREGNRGEHGTGHRNVRGEAGSHQSGAWVASGNHLSCRRSTRALVGATCHGSHHGSRRGGGCIREEGVHGGRNRPWEGGMGGHAATSSDRGGHFLGCRVESNFRGQQPYSSRCEDIPYVSDAGHALALKFAVVELLNGSSQIGGVFELNEAVVSVSGSVERP